MSNMSSQQLVSRDQDKVQTLEDWEILDEISSTRSASPVLVPTPPPAPYAHLPSWLYNQLCPPIPQAATAVEQIQEERPIFVARANSEQVREMEDSFSGMVGFEDVALVEKKKSKESNIGGVASSRMLQSSASVGRLASKPSSKCSSDPSILSVSDLKASKSLSDLGQSSGNLLKFIKGKECQTNRNTMSSMTILLMGDSVESWAAVGNKILGLNVFAGSTLATHHLRLQRASATRNNTRITLVAMPVLKPHTPLPPSLKSQLTSLLKTGVDAVLIGGSYCGSVQSSVEVLMQQVRGVAGDGAANHVLMLLKQTGGSVKQSERNGGDMSVDPCVQQIVQQAATRVLTVRGWESMSEKQVDKLMDMAYKLSINQGKFKVYSNASIPISKWPEARGDSTSKQVCVVGSSLQSSVYRQQERMTKLVGKMGGWFERFSCKFNCFMRWAIIAGFGATLASIFAAPLFGIGGVMIKPVVEIVSLSNASMFGCELTSTQRNNRYT